MYCYNACIFLYRLVRIEIMITVKWMVKWIKILQVLSRLAHKCILHFEAILVNIFQDIGLRRKLIKDFIFRSWSFCWTLVLKLCVPVITGIYFNLSGIWICANLSTKRQQSTVTLVDLISPGSSLRNWSSKRHPWLYHLHSVKVKLNTTTACSV